jgi:hypothetical protein
MIAHTAEGDSRPAPPPAGSLPRFPLVVNNHAPSRYRGINPPAQYMKVGFSRLRLSPEGLLVLPAPVPEVQVNRGFNPGELPGLTG